MRKLSSLRAPRDSAAQRPANSDGTNNNLLGPSRLFRVSVVPDGRPTSWRSIRLQLSAYSRLTVAPLRTCDVGSDESRPLTPEQPLAGITCLTYGKRIGDAIGAQAARFALLRLGFLSRLRSGCDLPWCTVAAVPCFSTHTFLFLIFCKESEP